MFSSSIPKELLPPLQTEEHLEQILADAGEGDTTDGTTDDDESAISTDISEADTDSNIPSAEALQSTSSLVTTEIAPNSEETPVVQILNLSNFLKLLTKHLLGLLHIKKISRCIGMSTLLGKHIF